MKITLKAARINANLPQTDVAAALGVSRKTVSSWESGHSMPKADQIDALCELFGVKYDDIKWRV